MNMFRNKIKDLLQQTSIDQTGPFEIIHDSAAMEILGGTSTCSKLESCQNYTGDCPNLTTCGTFVSTT